VSSTHLLLLLLLLLLLQGDWPPGCPDCRGAALFGRRGGHQQCTRGKAPL